MCNSHMMTLLANQIFIELKLQYSCISYLDRAKGRAFILILSLYTKGDFSSDKSQEVDHARLWELQVKQPNLV